MSKRGNGSFKSLTLPPSTPNTTSTRKRCRCKTVVWPSSPPKVGDPLIHRIWIALPGAVADWSENHLDSFRSFDEHVQVLWCYADPEVPAIRGLRLCDAEQLMPQSKVRWFLAGNVDVRHIKDILSMAAVWKFGGIYADLDNHGLGFGVAEMAPDGFLLVREPVKESSFMRRQWEAIGLACFGLPAASGLAKRCFEEFDNFWTKPAVRVHSAKVEERDWTKPQPAWMEPTRIFSRHILSDPAIQARVLPSSWAFGLPYEPTRFPLVGSASLNALASNARLLNVWGRQWWPSLIVAAIAWTKQQRAPRLTVVSRYTQVRQIFASLAQGIAAFIGEVEELRLRADELEVAAMPIMEAYFREPCDWSVSEVAIVILHIALTWRQTDEPALHAPMEEAMCDNIMNHTVATLRVDATRTKQLLDILVAAFRANAG